MGKYKLFLSHSSRDVTSPSMPTRAGAFLQTKSGVPDSGQKHTIDSNDGFLVTTTCLYASISISNDSGKRKSFGQSEVVRCGKERGTAGGRNDRGSGIKKT